jgi:hypothetical protein
MNEPRLMFLAAEQQTARSDASPRLRSAGLKFVLIAGDEANGGGLFSGLPPTLAARVVSDRFAYFRIITVDVVLVAARLDKCAEEQAIELGAWTDIVDQLGETSTPGCDLRLGA